MPVTGQLRIDYRVCSAFLRSGRGEYILHRFDLHLIKIQKDTVCVDLLSKCMEFFDLADWLKIETYPSRMRNEHETSKKQVKRTNETSKTAWRKYHFCPETVAFFPNAGSI